MPPTRSLMKDLRASFRRKKVDTVSKEEKIKKQEDEEQQKLLELKEVISKDTLEKYSDARLLGFLRARSSNVEEAKNLVNTDVSLRNFVQIEDFLKSYELTEFDKKYRISGVIGTDKDGTVVRVFNFFAADIKGFLHSLSTIDNFRLALWFLERDLLLQDEENRKNGKTNRQVTYIINLENLSFNKISYKPVFDTAMLGLRLFQDHFPDVPKMVYLVNAPSFFSSLFKMFKPVIGESLHQKIKVFDNNGAEELLKVIDADVLPACFGGNRTDPDGDAQCLDLIGPGGKIPENYFSVNSLSPDDSDVTSATIPAGTAINFRFKVLEIGSRISWHIQSKDNDICLAVFLKPLSEDDESSDDEENGVEDVDVSTLERLTPTIRTQCQIQPEIGSTIAWFTGTGIFHIDNTYSWRNPKEVMFKILVEPPAEKEESNEEKTKQTDSSSKP